MRDVGGLHPEVGKFFFSVSIHSPTSSLSPQVRPAPSSFYLLTDVAVVVVADIVTFETATVGHAVIAAVGLHPSPRHHPRGAAHSASPGASC